ncbi:NAD(P)H-dependent oxidoreductase [Prosthecobacter sp.]|uniref:NADPH-dependent FMN reductase n=1 Tax=Prosthecobacter sp. TaxID=1965333 RepID=UPI001D4E9780|nr:NAD(P)H-dependent oxidoreductase [Prosthecobacter sp.]MCB1277824.1 NAD(P)H-dependent oxidoreductase [Prosthecobacter sp.]
MNALIVSTALKPASKTLAAARTVQRRLTSSGMAADLADLSVEALPQCDGAACYQDAAVKAMTERVKAAQLIVLCFPVYNYQPNAAAKNFIEVTNEGWKDKVVTLVANAGGDRSYLAPMPLANSLMVDHRCLIVPQFLYLSPTAYDATGEVVLGGLTGELFEQQMKSAVHLAHSWPAR